MAREVETQQPVLSGTIVTHSSAEFRLAGIQDAVQNFHVLLAEAIRADDWITLGYPDLASWYRDAAAGKGVSPQARGELALALRERDYSLRAIGGILHVTKSTIQRNIALATGNEQKKRSRASTSPFTSWLRNKRQVTLPAEIREALRAEPGDELEFTIVKPGTVQIRVVPVAQQQDQSGE
jgi:AbrB family looped-hinge helix DNA binding protein